MIGIIRHRRIWFVFSGLLVTACVVAVMLFGLKPGIDFTGGALIEYTFPNGRPSLEEMKSAADIGGEQDALVQPSQEKNVLIRTKPLSEEKRVLLRSAFQEKFGADVQEERFESIGPTIGKELQKRSVYALLAAIAAIVLYVAYAFRKVSRQIPSLVLSFATTVALLHDVFIPIGVFAILGKTMGVEVDTLFITAMLTVLGFSVHDTIVVFDRIRHNLAKDPSPTFEQTVERSVNQTLVRSLNTSLTALLVLLVLFFLGGESIRWLVLALLIGLASGTYSSIFIASPVLVAWHNRAKRRG